MVRLIVGLGNPGTRYEGTRHNAGFALLDALARRSGTGFRGESRFHGDTAQLPGTRVRLLKPVTFMNESGRAVQAMAAYFDIEPAEILVAHDELDLPPGTVRLKQAGGHGGHNGLRSIGRQLGALDFLRLRLGVGHPGQADQVTPYVLGRAPAAEREALDGAIDRALDILPDVLDGRMEAAMQRLHTRPDPAAPPD